MVPTHVISNLIGILSNLLNQVTVWYGVIWYHTIWYHPVRTVPLRTPDLWAISPVQAKCPLFMLVFPLIKHFGKKILECPPTYLTDVSDQGQRPHKTGRGLTRSHIGKPPQRPRRQGKTMECKFKFPCHFAQASLPAFKSNTITSSCILRRSATNPP